METNKIDSFTNKIFGLEGYLEIGLGPSDAKEGFAEFLTRFFSEKCADWEIVEERGYPGEVSFWKVRFVGPTIDELYDSFPPIGIKPEAGVSIIMTYLGTDNNDTNMAIADKIYLLLGFPKSNYTISKHMVWTSGLNSLFISSASRGSIISAGSGGSAGILPHVTQVSHRSEKGKPTKGKKAHGIKNQNHVSVQHRKIHSNWSTRPRGR